MIPVEVFMMKGSLVPNSKNKPSLNIPVKEVVKKIKKNIPKNPTLTIKVQKH